ncbi:molybdenum ABC transporter substrate-binding protein [Bradyrhizobium sp. NAS80.1]|uniref:molybdate ABC transporter substrate-binding protein n=1 Tax=Bradyrhizobium sp. NAS80.1 TaxID=1680159 RepID=UPI0009598F53|nr:molybdate ABC transporter substrate-binding protein [Bradyrhizobium sp. NAS80.1]OKO87701.1 molybdenum ABC transporter substrate-binding protein [Bradyrhizobium sp. NAS80.1]
MNMSDAPISTLRRRGVVCALLLALIFSAGSPGRAQGAGADLLVFAAASLKTVLDDVNAHWQTHAGKWAAISYASSAALAKQIEQGAPADIFISADEDWMDYLAERKLIKPETRSDLVGNRLVLIAPKGADLHVDIIPGFPLPSLVGHGRLAMANTDAVPAGKYGRAALESLGVWDSVKDRIAQAENVRAALLLVSRGEAPLGIVYRSDAVSDPAVVTVGSFPESTHPRIIYPVAVVAGSTKPDAAAFIDLLRSPEARSIFEKQGFTILE